MYEGVLFELYTRTFPRFLIIDTPPAPSGLPANITAVVDWQRELRTVTTSAQIETDVMPFLGRTPDSGNFNGYYNVSKGSLFSVLTLLCPAS